MASTLALAHPLLRPLVGLATWTFVMEAWMYAYRIPALSKYKVDISPQMTSTSMNANIPRELQWPADNYNHLMEQPTVFYGVVLALDRLGVQDDVTSVANPVMVRFQIFLCSSAVLAGLTGKAVLAVM
ncbi:hypothetical protein LTS10_001455 [Elasticomyces elasticus]|nr:hypothetical protein LTS10_001455 [Elasticomyces elasticus]